MDGKPLFITVVSTLISSCHKAAVKMFYCKGLQLIFSAEKKINQVFLTENNVFDNRSNKIFSSLF